MDPTRKKKVVVIGAGIGGIATAARLAQCGVEVSVYEKNDFVGGKCSNITRNGFRFDRGPSLLLMTEIFEETYQHLGTSMPSEGIDLLKCDPNCNFWFDDGELFTTSTDIARMKRQLEKLDHQHGFGGFLAFLQESHQHYQQSVIHVLNKDFPGFLSLLRPAFLRYLFRLHPFHTVWQRASHFFPSHKLSQVFSLASMYLGMSPFEIPGTYTLLQYTELTGGIWYPRGGFYQIAESLANIGKRLGVSYHLSNPVKSITISPNKQALGVSFDSDEIVEADAIVVNADLLYAYKELLPSYSAKPSVSRKKEDISCSAITFYWSLSAKVPQLESHNMFVGQPCGQEFPDVHWNCNKLSKPSFYVHVPSRTDPSAAPEGKDTVMVLILVDNIDTSKIPRESDISDIDGLVANTREYILSCIENRTGIVGLNALIEHESFHSPKTWQEMFNSDRGSVFGLNHNFFNILSFRPHLKHDVIDGIYFVGASTHPGAGVPTCLSGAKLTAERVLRDLDVPISWQTGSAHGKKDLLRTTAYGYWWALQRMAFLGALSLIVAMWHM